MGGEEAPARELLGLEANKLAVGIASQGVGGLGCANKCGSPPGARASGSKAEEGKECTQKWSHWAPYKVAKPICWDCKLGNSSKALQAAQGHLGSVSLTPKGHANL